LRDPIATRRPSAALAALLMLASSLSGCVPERRAETPVAKPAQARALIDASLPSTLADRAGWAADLLSGFNALGIEPSRDTVCAVVAVIEQESGFRVDPLIPDLGAIAWREIDVRADRALLPRAIVHGVLKLQSSTGRSYGDRINRARTERELSDIYEDFIAAVPLGRTPHARAHASQYCVRRAVCGGQALPLCGEDEHRR
jgi:hypothetical protein